MIPSLGNLLLVDNEPQILRVLTSALAAAGYTLICAQSGEAALRLAVSRGPDAILLDLSLPDMDGHEVLVRLREFTDVPIIIVSLRDHESDKVRALDAGADDYVKKPFHLGELLARIRASLRHRRVPDSVDDAVILGALTIDTTAHRVILNGQVVALTKNEHALLLILARNRGSVVSHSEILTAIWGESHSNDFSYLRVYIGRLRGKLGPEFGALIRTESGIGYCLQDPLGAK